METLYVIDMYNHSEGRCIIVFDNEDLYTGDLYSCSHIPIPVDMDMIGIMRFIREVLHFTEDKYSIQLFGYSDVHSNLIIPATINNMNYPMYEIVTVDYYKYAPPGPKSVIMRCVRGTDLNKLVTLGKDVYVTDDTINEIIESRCVESNCDILVIHEYTTNNDLYLIRDNKIVGMYTDLPC